MSRNTIIKKLVTLGVLIAVSCSFFTQPTKITSTGSNQEVSGMITASQGGELALPDNAVLKIPAGSLKTDTQVSLRRTTAENAPTISGELSIIGGVYDITLGTSSLEKPVILEIPFDPTLLPNGAEPSQVFLSYYDEITKEWVYAGGEVDTNRNVVVLEITHASWWMPTTWNWEAWIAVLNKFLRVSIVDWIEAVQLLTDDCPQAGDYVQVDSSQARNLVQGCVEQDDIERPVLRVINPKAFFFEIKPISGGNGYPSPTLLSPGEDLKFEASTSDPSPLIIEAQMTQRSGWYLVIHMIITMLPGANQFGIQGRDVACITERLADVSYFASAVESLLVDQNGAAAAESLGRFMIDDDAVQRFITAADDCHFGPAPTWSVEGIKQIGGAVSTIMSATDFIANYCAGNTSAQLSFAWTSSVANYAYSLFDDFSSYKMGLPPTGWLIRGEESISPIIEEVGGSGPQYQVVSFPEVPWEYWDKWLLRPSPVFSHSYEIIVKLKFLNEVADRAGITIAWDDDNWNRIDIQPNVYWDDIEFRITYNGPIVANPIITNVGNISIAASKEYWLRVVAQDNGPGLGQVTVYWSIDGISYDPVVIAKGLANLTGLVGVSTAGPHLPNVIFDDFQVEMK